MSVNVSGIRIADLLDGVPVRAARRKVERAARSHAEQPALGIEHVEERKEVALVGAAAVEEDEQPFGLARGRARQMAQCVRGHVRRTLAAGELPRSATRRSSSAWSQPFMKSACAPKLPDATCDPERHRWVEDDEDDLSASRPGATRGSSPREGTSGAACDRRCRAAVRPSSSGTWPGAGASGPRGSAGMVAKRGLPPTAPQLHATIPFGWRLRASAFPAIITSPSAARRSARASD